MSTGLTRICQLSLGVNLRLRRRTSHRDSSLHRRLTGQVGQRRPPSSRPTSRQASLRERVREIRKSSRLRVSLCFIAWAISLWSEDHISGVHYIVERQLLRLADLPRQDCSRSGLSACSAFQIRLNNRGKRSWCEFGCRRAFEPSDDFMCSVAKCSRRAEVSQSQTPHAQ